MTGRSIGHVLLRSGMLGLALTVAGCTSDNPGAGGDGSTSGDGGSVNFDRCSSAKDCPPDKVCHPYAGTCLTAGDPCGDQAECPKGMYCEPGIGACLASATGNPCASDDNCSGKCSGGVCGCDGLRHERQLSSSPLDVYLILDRTGSMDQDCAYKHGDAPPVKSKACYATYALSDYLIDVAPVVDTRLAFHFMSQPEDCNGDPYMSPLFGLTQLPVAANHGLIQAISDETFKGGLGTHIEGALRGLARYTAANATPGREMIGVLMTDGDPSGCVSQIPALRKIVADHLAATGIRTFIIGMQGATDANLEQLASAGGADAHSDWCGGGTSPCHYWNVGNGSGDAIANALQAIIKMAVPLPCQLDVAALEPPPGETLDFNRVNVTLTEGATITTIGQVGNAAACPSDRPAWYYDDPASPKQIHLCPTACTLAGDAGQSARLDVVVGCRDTVTIK